MEIITKKHIEVVEKAFNEIQNLDDFINNSQCPKVLTASINFIEKIKNLQFDLDSVKSNYTSKCLLRTIIEHFLVNYYIFYRFELEQKDYVGEKYYIDYFVSENFKKDMYQLGIDGMLNSQINNATFENLKIKLAPDFDDLTQPEYDNINKEGKQFDIKKIQNFLLTNPLPEDHFGLVNKELIPDLLSQYNVLSSFIHGGPSAEMEFKKNKTKVDDAKEWAVIIVFFTVTNFFILLISLDRKFEYLKVYLKLDNESYK